MIPQKLPSVSPIAKVSSVWLLPIPAFTLMPLHLNSYFFQVVNPQNVFTSPLHTDPGPVTCVAWPQGPGWKTIPEACVRTWSCQAFFKQDIMASPGFCRRGLCWIVFIAYKPIQQGNSHQEPKLLVTCSEYKHSTHPYSKCMLV